MSVSYFNDQLVVGLGLPMEIDVSTIVGYVLKFNYNLPYNASYLTESYVHYERSLDHVAYQPNEQLNFIQEGTIYKILCYYT